MRRPAVIRAFAALFVAQGLIAFAAALADLPATQARYATMLPGLAVTRDHAIIASSAQATIVLIPVALAWWRRARLVRWLVPAMVALRMVRGRPDMAPVEWLTLGLAVAAAACLFLPGARRWFHTPPPLQGRGRSAAGAEGAGDVLAAPRSLTAPTPSPSPEGEGG